METFATVAPILLWVVIPIITGLLAKRKGYSFFIWIFATGVLGLVILAFLPFANKAGTPAEEQASRKRTGNIIGGVLAGIGIVFGALRLLGGS